MKESLLLNFDFGRPKKSIVLMEGEVAESWIPFRIRDRLELWLVIVSPRLKKDYPQTKGSYLMFSERNTLLFPLR